MSKGLVTHKIEHNLEDVVYLKTDQYQVPRMITGIMLRPCGAVIYYLSLGADETTHYGIEIDSERDIIKATTN